MQTPQPPKSDVVTDHRRQWRNCRYVYPVISRRARGLSIGVNLSIDKRCNFGCLYCQIDRTQPRQPFAVDMNILREELTDALADAQSGRLWQNPRFADTPANMRRINDIAFSGDGEPTCLPNFDQAVAAAVDALADKHLLGEAKIVVITNASQLQSPQFQRALPLLQQANGEIWVKLDAGTEEFFRTVNQPTANITLDGICDNIATVGKQFPVVIQSLFFLIDNQPPSNAELTTYIERLRTIHQAGGQLKLIQIHTIARPPAASNVATLPNDQLDAIAKTIRQNFATATNIPVEVYYGRDVKPQHT